MQFRDYIFRHNPAKITVSSPKAVVTHLCPGGAEIAQELGERARVVTCSGSFFGASMGEAMGQLLEFRQRSAGEGMLYLPGLPPFPARLLELVFDAEGDGRIILYTMKFIETFMGHSGGQAASPPPSPLPGVGITFGGDA
jgi:hypothetical protein